jgi:hypothetical protein
MGLVLQLLLKIERQGVSRKNGHTSSIMDYARFNYVAQPEDMLLYSLEWRL